MKIVYMGKKRPKKVFIGEREDAKEYLFDPFKEVEVPDEVGQLLINNAGDMFKRTDSRKEPNPIKASGDGYVGDVHVAELPDIEKQKKIDAKHEAGKEIEEIIESDKKEKIEGEVVKISQRRGRPRKGEIQT